jgi:hypothetical protein
VVNPLGGDDGTGTRKTHIEAKEAKKIQNHGMGFVR